ncbi:uncharacterized protein [Argopecten irradians]|uniref:uncharacterized protein n=1 Tax=Argopecten irradians TaxID=31199 RepID=UPI00371580E4
MFGLTSTMGFASKVRMLWVVSNVVFMTSGIPTETVTPDSSVRTECNSYAVFTDKITKSMEDTISDTADRIYKPEKVLKSAIIKEVQTTCAVMANNVKQLMDDVRLICTDMEMTLANMHVFGGICTDNGSVTSLGKELLTGYDHVVSACVPNLHPILWKCKREEISKDMDILAGRREYSRIMPEHISCWLTDIDKLGDVPLCGSTSSSVKRMAVLFELLTYPGPGVTFTLSNFRL